MYTLLSLETSCDDTSVALLQSEDHLTGFHPYKVLFHQSFSQEFILKKWGGVVPEIAARNHLEKIFPLIHNALTENNVSFNQISAIAVTQGPGLLGPLLTGLNTAKAIALTYKIPIIGVNHLFAHLEAIFHHHKIRYPYIGCVISGGHTFFALVENSDSWKLLGSTTDDALGEALDKGGKLLGLPYPAGKHMDGLSQNGSVNIHFPIGLSHDKTSCKVSYSGLKNSLRVYLQQHPGVLKDNAQNNQQYFDLITSYMDACLQTLLEKIPNAYKHAQKLNSSINDNTPLVFGGGVAMSKVLQQKVSQLAWKSYFVHPSLCTDNALMIGIWALKNKHLQKNFPDCLSMDAFSRYLNRQDQSWISP